MTSTSSAAFAAFMEQLQAKGYEKAQGYNPEWFDQMSPTEKQQAEVLLIQDLKNNDLTAADPLGRLATTTARDALLQCLQQAQVPSRKSAEIASALWIATKDVAYQKLLIANLSTSNDLYRVSVVVQLLQTSPTSELLDKLMDLAENDSYDTVRSSAAEGALYCVGLLPDRSVFNHPYRPLQQTIASNDSAVRIQAFTELRRLVDAARANVNLP